ncbi:MAG: fimbrillin family protein [Muribaculaceae bacterium]|nr:fimbrillin family protein [Muribaculaceae bacterium]
MKHFLAIFLISCLSLGLSGCSKGGDEPTPEPAPAPAPAPAPTPDPDPDPVPGITPVEIKINPSVASDSRATDFGFESGDCIGLYVVNRSGSTPGALADNGNHVTNMRFTYNGTWIPDTPIYWADDETHADFYLYFPYVSNVISVKTHPFTVLPDQSTDAAYKASDLMVGKTVDVAPTESAISINVTHAMSRMIIQLEAGNGFTAESLASAEIAVKINGIRCSSTLDIASGSVTAVGDPSTVTPLPVDNYYKALIVPQTVPESDLITINVDGKDYNLTKGFTFEAGKSHKFNVVLSKTSSGVNVSIDPWDDDDTDNGGTAE